MRAHSSAQRSTADPTTLRKFLKPWTNFWAPALVFPAFTLNSYLTSGACD
jgi:hypothetical protein